MNDTVDGCQVKGEVLLDGDNIYQQNLDVVELRARVGMVFQKPNPFPKSIFENVAYGPRIHGLAKSDDELDELVTQSLVKAGLFQEIKTEFMNPEPLIRRQQQRLCIARTIAISPQII